MRGKMEFWLNNIEIAHIKNDTSNDEFGIKASVNVLDIHFKDDHLAEFIEYNAQQIADLILKDSMLCAYIQRKLREKGKQ